MIEIQGKDKNLNTLHNSALNLSTDMHNASLWLEEFNIVDIFQPIALRDYNY